jgi:hypothetical protein
MLVRSDSASYIPVSMTIAEAPQPPLQMVANGGWIGAPRQVGSHGCITVATHHDTSGSCAGQLGRSTVTGWGLLERADQEPSRAVPQGSTGWPLLTVGQCGTIGDDTVGFRGRSPPPLGRPGRDPSGERAWAACRVAAGGTRS